MPVIPDGMNIPTLGPNAPTGVTPAPTPSQFAGNGGLPGVLGRLSSAMPGAQAVTAQRPVSPIEGGGRGPGIAEPSSPPPGYGPNEGHMPGQISAAPSPGGAGNTMQDYIARAGGNSGFGYGR